MHTLSALDIYAEMTIRKAWQEAEAEALWLPRQAATLQRRAILNRGERTCPRQRRAGAFTRLGSDARRRRAAAAAAVPRCRRRSCRETAGRRAPRRAARAEEGLQWRGHCGGHAHEVKPIPLDPLCSWYGHNMLARRF